MSTFAFSIDVRPQARRNAAILETPGELDADVYAKLVRLFISFVHQDLPQFFLSAVALRLKIPAPSSQIHSEAPTNVHTVCITECPSSVAPSPLRDAHDVNGHNWHHRHHYFSPTKTGARFLVIHSPCRFWLLHVCTKMLQKPSFYFICAQSCSLVVLHQYTT